jgi:hypothetical protein
MTMMRRRQLPATRDGAGGFVTDPPANLPTLNEVGIAKALARKARNAFSLPADIFEDAVQDRRCCNKNNIYAHLT